MFRGAPAGWAIAAAVLLGYGLLWVAPFPLGALYRLPGDALYRDPGFYAATTGLFCPGIGLLFGLYYLGYRRLSRDPRTFAPLCLYGFPLCAGGSLVAAFPVTSGDVYYYIMGGHLYADLGLNPAVVPPSAVVGDPLLPYVAWPDLPSPYGPLWTYAAGALRALAGEDLLANLVAHKVTELALLYLIGLLAWVYLRRTRPERANVGLYLVLWNPLALWESAGAGHNGLFSLAAVLLALLALTAVRWRSFAMPLLVAGVLFKFVPMIFLPLTFLWLVLDAGRRRAVWGRLALGTLLGVGLTLLAFAPVWQGLESLAVMQEATLFTRSAGSIAIVALTPVVSYDLALLSVRVVAYGMYAAIYLILLWRVGRDRRALVRSAYYANTALLVVATLWFEPWYTLGPLALAALSGDPRLELQAVLFTFGAMASYVTDVAAALAVPPAALVALQALGLAIGMGPLVGYWLLSGPAARARAALGQFHGDRRAWGRAVAVVTVAVSGPTERP